MKEAHIHQIKGLSGTIIFHAIIISIFLTVTLATNPPLFPEPEGVEVNFGNGETGLGDVEPGPNEMTNEAVAQEATQQTPTDLQQTSYGEQPANSDIQSDVVATNDEDAVASVAQKQLEEQNKQALIEQKRIADEQKRIADEQQQKINAINARTGKLFGKGTGTGSEGIAGGYGNQGNPNGVANSPNYKGLGGNGKVQYSLAGRRAVDLENPQKGIQASGKVVVEILVDRDGNVIDARPGVKGSTTANEQLYDAAEKAALNTKFDPSPNSAERQKGYLTYVFELQ